MTRVVAKHHNPKCLTVTYMHTVAEMLEEIRPPKNNNHLKIIITSQETARIILIRNSDIQR